MVGIVNVRQTRGATQRGSCMPMVVVVVVVVVAIGARDKEDVRYGPFMEQILRMQYATQIYKMYPTSTNPSSVIVEHYMTREHQERESDAIFSLDAKSMSSNHHHIHVKSMSRQSCT